MILQPWSYCVFSPLDVGSSDEHISSAGGGGRKRRLSTSSANSSKKPRLGDSGDSDSSNGLTDFDPASIVQTKDGALRVPKTIEKYLSRHLKHCLTKEEREALFREHPRPDVDATLAPRVDRYISDFLGKKFPKERDAELTKIQTAVLACIRPLTSAWQELLEEGLERDTTMMLPATEVLAVIQRSLCLIGNASEYISQTRRSRILEAIEPSWSKFAKDEFKSSDTLFGKDFQSSLTDKVEKDVALSKAVSIMKRSQKSKEQPTSSSKREGQTYTRFFRGGPPAKYGGRQGKSLYPYTPQNRHFREREPGRGRQSFHNSRGQGQRYHEPRLPQADPHPQKKF